MQFHDELERRRILVGDFDPVGELDVWPQLAESMLMMEDSCSGG